jgi:hypothetical protein
MDPFVVARNPDPARGEIRWGELPDVGRRPHQVLTRDVAIPVARRVVGAASQHRTGESRSRQLKRSFPWHHR